MAITQTQVTQKLEKNRKSAEAYAEIIRLHANGTTGEHGRLYNVKVTTNLVKQFHENGQPSLLWRDSAFDSALAQVIADNLPEFAERAMAAIDKEIRDSMVQEEDELRARLQAIQEMKGARA